VRVALADDRKRRCVREVPHTLNILRVLVVHFDGVEIRAAFGDITPSEGMGDDRGAPSFVCQ